MAIIIYRLWFSGFLKMFFRSSLLFLLVFVSPLTLFNSGIYAASDSETTSDSDGLRKLELIRSSEIEHNSIICSICLDEFNHEENSEEELVIVCDRPSSPDETQGDIELGLIANREANDPRHIFHKDCLGEWIAIHPDCPICRKNVKFDATYKSVIKNVKSKKIKTRYEWERSVAGAEVDLFPEGEHDGEGFIAWLDENVSYRQRACCAGSVIATYYTLLIVYHFVREDSYSWLGR